MAIQMKVVATSTAMPPPAAPISGPIEPEDDGFPWGAPGGEPRGAGGEYDVVDDCEQTSSEHKHGELCRHGPCHCSFIANRPGRQQGGSSRFAVKTAILIFTEVAPQ